MQLCEAKTGRMERVARFLATDENPDLTAGSFFGGGDGLHNSVVIDSLEEMMWFHAVSQLTLVLLWESVAGLSEVPFSMVQTTTVPTGEFG